jgi:hypothetical protein
LETGTAGLTGAATPGGIEARGAHRFTLLVRAAKLIADGREFLCVLRDASATGVKVRLFHPVPPARELALELGNGDRFPMKMMWLNQDHAGFRFEHEIDVQHLIEDRVGDFPKRQIRLNTEHPMMLFSGSVAHPAVLRNISQQGACVECDHRLMVRQLVRLEIDGFPAMFAKVCWRRHPYHGMVFERAFNLEELAHNVLRLHTAAGAIIGGEDVIPSQRAG